MRIHLPLLLFLSILISRPCPAQDQPPTDDWRPASSNQPGKDYPQVNSERCVKFRIVAPQAKSVGCSFRDSSDFIQGDDGAWIMDNLIAENRSRPFLIVMTNGMTNDIRFGGLRNFEIGPFETVLVRELIPYVDAHFRTLSDQPNRAMAGLSMGAMETRMITLRNLDTFSHIGLFSGGSISMEDVNQTDGFKEKVRLVFVSYGSRELDGGRSRRGDPHADMAALKEAGIPSHFYVSPDTAHEWQSWRRSLREFAPLLFKH